MSTEAWKLENTARMNMRMLKNSPDYIALEKATAAESITAVQYIRRALHEQLIRDGYLNAEDVSAE